MRFEELKNIFVLNDNNEIEDFKQKKEIMCFDLFVQEKNKSYQNILQYYIDKFYNKNFFNEKFYFLLCNCELNNFSGIHKNIFHEVIFKIIIEEKNNFSEKNLNYILNHSNINQYSLYGETIFAKLLKNKKYFKFEFIESVYNKTILKKEDINELNRFNNQKLFDNFIKEIEIKKEKIALEKNINFKDYKNKLKNNKI